MPVCPSCHNYVDEMMVSAHLATKHTHEDLVEMLTKLMTEEQRRGRAHVAQ